MRSLSQTEVPAVEFFHTLFSSSEHLGQIRLSLLAEGAEEKDYDTVRGAASGSLIFTDQEYKVKTKPQVFHPDIHNPRGGGESYLVGLSHHLRHSPLAAWRQIYLNPLLPAPNFVTISPTFIEAVWALETPWYLGHPEPFRRALATCALWEDYFYQEQAKHSPSPLLPRIGLASSVQIPAGNVEIIHRSHYKLSLREFERLARGLRA